MKKLVALLLAVAMLLSFAACGEKTPDPVETTVSDETTDAGEVVDATTAGTEEDSTAEEPVSDEVTTLEGETTAEGETTSAEEATTAAMPVAKDEIISYYNATINKAYNAKVGFSKERYTDNEVMNAGFLLKQFDSLIYKFMGVGAENKYSETVTKGQWDTDLKHHYLRKSTLTAADVTNATCTANGNQYTVVLNVKDGTSVGSKSTKTTNAPIDKCGICVGNEDKGYYDHKTGPVIYDAVDDFLGGAVISEKYSKAKVVAVIDATTGNLVKLTVEFNIAVDIEAAGGGTATAITHIKYNNFKY